MCIALPRQRARPPWRATASRCPAVAWWRRPRRHAAQRRWVIRWSSRPSARIWSTRPRWAGSRSICVTAAQTAEAAQRLSGAVRYAARRGNDRRRRRGGPRRPDARSAVRAGTGDRRGRRAHGAARRQRDAVAAVLARCRAIAHSPRLKLAKLLDGFRGKPRGDVDALVEVVSGIARYASAQLSTLQEIDVNPVIVRPAGKGAVAVDALIRLKQSRSVKGVRHVRWSQDRHRRQHTRGHDRPAQGQRHRSRDQSPLERGVRQVPRRQVAAHRHHHRRRREILLSRLGSQGRRGRREIGRGLGRERVRRA